MWMWLALEVMRKVQFVNTASCYDLCNTLLAFFVNRQVLQVKGIQKLKHFDEYTLSLLQLGDCSYTEAFEETSDYSYQSLLQRETR